MANDAGARSAWKGFSMIELMFVVSLTTVLLGMALPRLLTGLDAMRSTGAARYVASRAQLARMLAATRSVNVGIRFEAGEDGYRYATYRDGNANGLRAADIRRGVDPVVGSAERLADRFTGVRFGIVPGVAPISGGSLAPGSDPVRLGRGETLIFTPLGTSSGGTIYITGRSGRQLAVRVLAATGRTRVLEFNFGDGKWLPK